MTNVRWPAIAGPIRGLLKTQSNLFCNYYWSRKVSLPETMAPFLWAALPELHSWSLGVRRLWRWSTTASLFSVFLAIRSTTGVTEFSERTRYVTARCNPCGQLNAAPLQSSTCGTRRDSETPFAISCFVTVRSRRVVGCFPRSGSLVRVCFSQSNTCEHENGFSSPALQK